MTGAQGDLLQTSPGTAAAAQARVTAVTQHVKALADTELVSTAPTRPAGGRCSFVQTTEAGRTELRQLLRIGDQVFGAVVTDWSAEDVVALTALLDRLSESRAARDRTTKPSKHPARQPLRPEPGLTTSASPSNGTTDVPHRVPALKRKMSAAGRRPTVSVSRDRPRGVRGTPLPNQVYLGVRPPDVQCQAGYRPGGVSRDEIGPNARRSSHRTRY
ncbi:hypothetical protein AB0H00_19600 [Nocardia sp. NPDC023852]|uniref:hypothetical protein n=1 Tax=Nocardia sp. NPDC023852 TaxID=3154697 RepID=UPI0033F152CB